MHGNGDGNHLLINLLNRVSVVTSIKGKSLCVLGNCDEKIIAIDANGIIGLISNVNEVIIFNSKDEILEENFIKQFDLDWDLFDFIDIQ